MKTLLWPVFPVSLVLSAPANGQTPNEAALRYSPSLDLSSMDKSIDPCVNFYQYACAGWRRKNPIPADQTSWNVYEKLYQDNLYFLRAILEQAASGTNPRDALTGANLFEVDEIRKVENVELLLGFTDGGGARCYLPPTSAGGPI